MKPLFHAAVLLPALLASSAAVDAKDPPQINPNGQYSSLVRTESEDDVGMKILVGYSNRGWYAILQCAGGNLDRPVVVTAQVDKDKRTIRFARHDDPDNECPREAFVGRYDANGMNLSYPGGYDPGTLKRGRNLW